MAMTRSAFLLAVALLLGTSVPHAAAEAINSVFTLLSELQLQQQSRRQALRASPVSLLQRSEPTSTQSTENTFHGLDRNSDGLLSRDEIASFAASQGLDEETAKSELALLDNDGDGSLNKSEFVSGLNPADATGVDATVDAAALLSQAAEPVPAARTERVTPVTQATLTAHSVPMAQVASEQTASAAVDLTKVVSGSDFVSVKAKELLSSWNKFESDAKSAEAEARALRAKARKELQEAQELQAIADFAVLRAKQAASHQ